MSSISFLHLKPSQWGRAFLRGVVSWWQMVHLGAMMLVLAFSPSTYGASNRGAASRYIYASTWQVLPWFTVLSALISQVLIRIVVVTALSYGLSQYALEMMVRVLVLELIPLAAALFVTLRSGLAFDATATAELPPIDLAHLQRELVPQVLAGAFAVVSLAAVSSVLVLVLAYLNVYGFSIGGLGDYTRTVGRVFEPVITIGFALKTVLFGLAVAVIPMATLIGQRQAPKPDAGAVQPGAVRLLSVLLLIEAGSLAIKYI
jgi:phospholipid/cholesterol/gamma-HCH transport system permease protein